MIPLDTLEIDRCHMVKIDAESMENEVLAGAEKLIATHRPVLYVENDRRHRSEELIGRLFGLGYHVWWHLPHLFNQDNFSGVTENIFPLMISVNMIAIPRENPVTLDLREVQDPSPCALNYLLSITPVSPGDQCRYSGNPPGPYRLYCIYYACQPLQALSAGHKHAPDQGCETHSTRSE